jgi:hypothetical protein
VFYGCGENKMGRREAVERENEKSKDKGEEIRVRRDELVT